MMRIGFNARCLASPHIRGWKRYSLCLLRELIALGCRPVLLSDKTLTTEHLEGLEPGSYEVDVAPPSKYLVWEQVWLPLACRRHRVDLLHSPMNFGLPAVVSVPTVLTLHDAIDLAFAPPQRPSLKERLHRASHFIARSSASRVITVSDHARRDIEHFFAIPRAKLVVIPEAADVGSLGVGSERDAEHASSVGAAGRFVLYAGGFEARKNVVALVDGFLEGAPPDVRLLLVGKNLPLWLERRVQAASGRLLAPGYVSDEVLGALYRQAICFVYPSLYEGFGLQLCEAMSQGCAVLAADATSLPEVLGDGGALFDPRAPHTLARLLARVCEDTTYLAELRRLASQRSRHFTWAQTGRLTLELYRSLL